MQESLSVEVSAEIISNLELIYRGKFRVKMRESTSQSPSRQFPTIRGLARGLHDKVGWMDGLPSIMKCCCRLSSLVCRFPFHFASIFNCNLVSNWSKKVAMGWARFGLVLGLFHGPFGLFFGSRRDVKLKCIDSKLFWMRVICFGFENDARFKIK